MLIDFIGLSVHLDDVKEWCVENYGEEYCGEITEITQPDTTALMNCDQCKVRKKPTQLIPLDNVSLAKDLSWFFLSWIELHGGPFYGTVTNVR